jgi:hypothetical protein
MFAIYSGPSCNFHQPRAQLTRRGGRTFFGVTRHRSPTILRATAPIRLPANELSALTDLSRRPLAGNL